MTFRAAFYKGTRAGIPGVYNRAVRAWEHGPYSHVELQFSDGISASSSFMDGGVRFKQIDYDPAKWDFLPLPPCLERAARLWFECHEGEDYSVQGNLHCVIGFIPPGPLGEQFCSQALGAALSFEESWRLMPNALYRVLQRLNVAYYTLPATGLRLA